MIVPAFRQILIWPLHLVENEPQPGTSSDLGGDRLQILAARLTAGQSAWKAIPDYYQHDAGADPAARYAGFVYFHLFVQRFLYGHQPAMLAFNREDVKAVRIKISAGSRTIDKVLNVDRTQFYLDTNVGLLAIEVSGSDMPMEDVLDIQDRLRRAYPPYWFNNTAGSPSPGLCPDLVEWIGAGGEAIGDPSNFDDFETNTKFLETYKTPPVAKHWRWLLEPMRPAPTQLGHQIGFRQIGDDRIPSMSYVAVDDVTALRRSDFVRLTFLDGGDNLGCFTYSQPFLVNFERDYCYDRFWDPSGSGYAYPMSTRYLCCGYAFTVVGDATSSFFSDLVSAHFRNHYFQVGLIAHFHRAALLGFLDRISSAAAQLPPGMTTEPSRQRFRRAVQAIEHNLAEFTSRYWFTEVSNQDQGRELFALWSKHLSTPELYERVTDEAASIGQVVRAMQEERLNQAALRLMLLAFLAAVVALAFGFFAMQILVPQLKHWLPSGGEEVGALACVGAVLFLLLMLLSRSRRLRDLFSKMIEPEA